MFRSLKLSSLLLLLVVWMPSGVANKATTTAPNNGNGNSNTEFMETEASFVKNQAATDTNNQMGAPIKLTVWTTPNRDWDATLEMRLRAIITRFGDRLVKFHPHQVIADGTMEPYACRENDGAVDMTALPETCLTECLNAGRYCVVTYPDMPSTAVGEGADANAHMGLTGADVVMESMRRLCVWIVYGANLDTMPFYWNYMTALRQTRCDMSLNDNCLDRVYEQVGIKNKDVTDCFHSAGGAGTQVDARNHILQEEMHKSLQLLEEFNATDIPHLTIDGVPVYQANNITATSDWQLLALTCNAFGMPKPPVCDFCLLECPNGNPEDRTRQCLWDLTCGDDRNFDDWMNGVGVFAAGSNNGTTTTSTTAPAPEEQAKPTMAPSSAPEDEAGSGGKDEQGGDGNNDNTGNEEEEGAPLELYAGGLPSAAYATNNAMGNATNATDAGQGSSNNDTEAAVTPPPQHHNTNNNNHASSQMPTPSIAPTTLTTPAAAPTYAGGASYTQPKTNPPHFGANHTNGNDNAQHTNSNYNGGNYNGGSGSGSSGSSNSGPGHSSSGGTLASPHKTASQSKPANTTTAGSAFGGVLIAVMCLGGVIGGIVFYKKWKYGKEYATVVSNADRAEGGLATTASHATSNDLELNVEMSTSTKSKGGGYYAPPSSGTGTWS